MNRADFKQNYLILMFTYFLLVLSVDLLVCCFLGDNAYHSKDHK